MADKNKTREERRKKMSIDDSAGVCSVCHAKRKPGIYGCSNDACPTHLFGGDKR